MWDIPFQGVPKIAQHQEAQLVDSHSHRIPGRNADIPPELNHRKSCADVRLGSASWIFVLKTGHFKKEWEWL